MGISISENLVVSATSIANEFIDHYMADASGEAIKVFLYFLRHGAEHFDVSEAADALNLTDNDIERAVRYWEKKGVLASGAGQAVRTRIREEEHAMTEDERGYDTEAVSMDPDEDGQYDGNAGEPIAPSNFRINPAAVSSTEAALAQSIVTEMPTAMKSVSFTCNLDDVKDDEEFASILFVAKHVLPSLPSVKQVETLEYMYKHLNMSADLIEYLLEYCADKKKTTYQYMGTVALNWHEQGITTVRQAKELVKSFTERSAEPKVEHRAKTVRKTNRFINLEQADVDYDLIARQKVMDRMKNGTE